MLVSYNGIYLPYSQMSSFRCEYVYDESKTDKLYTRFDIGVQCLITSEAMDMLAPDLEGRTTSPADIMRHAELRLREPRKTLSVKFNDVEYIPGKAGVPGTVDAANGPQPQDVTFLQMNNTTWMVTFRVVAHYRINYTVSAGGEVTFTNKATGSVISNRWEESVQINNLELSTRTRRGRLIIRSDNLAGYLADEVRSQAAVIGVPRGFLRVSRDYTVDPNGLGLRYSCVDQEVYRMPPQGALTADGDYTETSSRGDGKRYGQVHLRLEAAKDFPQHNLVKLAFAVAAGKLNLQGANFFDPNPDLRGIVISSTLRVGMYRNTVEVGMQCQYTVPIERVQGVAMISPNISMVHDSDGLDPQPQYRDRGTAQLLLNAANYYDPELFPQLVDGRERTPINPNTPQGGVNQFDRGKAPGEAGKKPE